jgi:hypothetical protein
MNYKEPAEGKNPELWKVAQRRVSFKRHLTTYLAVNAFLWILWLMSDRTTDGILPWPAWSTLGWGIGLGSHFFSAYSYGTSSVEREYEKLERKHKL